MIHELFSTTLKQKIHIMENLSTNDLEENWQTKGAYFAQVRHLSPSTARFFEGVDFGNLISENYIILRVRFTSEITKNMRIKFKDKSFLIKKMVNVLEQNKLFEIIAMEVA